MSDIKKLIRSLHIPGTLKGCVFLVSCIKIGISNEKALFCLSQKIFPIVAKENNTTGKCVERNIRTAIDACWNSDGRERLFEIAGRTFERRPPVSEMLDILVNYCAEMGYTD